ncbi:HAD family hydrolase [Herbaspirillum rhizosphaerae]|uniref:HAD family hydrolase n=1 Tax=Herbaspirillum rhizosphaerae TaxID=346179 RepID=UPI00067B8D79|nr:HAD family hydrolase [Herbaspirillum rhizosphaerae]
MRIGLDFDNTIVTYDSLFHMVAVEKALVPADTPVSKVAVRDYLRKIGNEPAFTEMQGYVYGARMKDADAYPGVVDFIRRARASGAEVVIVSHKTKHPFLGPKYDLHAAAAGWIDVALRSEAEPLLAEDCVFFELTKEEKIARIAACDCDYFIDDLPEILKMPGYPAKTSRLLFDPEQNHDAEGVTARFISWAEIQAFFEEKWRAKN